MGCLFELFVTFLISLRFKRFCAIQFLNFSKSNKENNKKLKTRQQEASADQTPATTYDSF
jgi:hypothetical protein